MKFAKGDLVYLVPFQNRDAVTPAVDALSRGSHLGIIIESRNDLPGTGLFGGLFRVKWLKGREREWSRGDRLRKTR